MNIYFFGDSISFGQGISIDLTWVNKIAQQLHRQCVGEQNMVINVSVNGNTTRMALERMPYDIQSHEVDVLVVGFGMNDCNYWITDKGVPRVSPKAFKANLEEIVERGFHFGVKEVLLRTNHPSPRKDYMINTKITYGESNHQYNDIIREVAKNDPRIKFVDMEQEFDRYIMEHNIRLEELTLSDGVHLSLLGHDVYFESMYPMIANIVSGE
ncbi:SGNH/GDSL hydrolase family protein [Lachnospiraceae bacterium 47-T17]